MRPNIVLIIVDSLRYDRCGFSGHRPGLMPNFMNLAGRSRVYHNHFSTGCPTQIAMPAVFSSTYPLDNGGYDMGIVDRPHSITECLRDAGYRTLGVHSTSHTSSLFGYGRGFDQFTELVDLQSWFGGAYIKGLADKVEKWRRGNLSDEEISVFLGREYSLVLSGAIALIENMDRVRAPEGFRRRRRVHTEVLREQEILRADPLTVAHKISALGRHYDLGLGHASAGPDLVRSIERYDRFQMRVSKRVLLASRRRCAGKAGVVNSNVRNVLADTANQPPAPTFLYVHYFDIHESKVLIPQMSLERLRRLPRDLARTAFDRSPRNQPGGRLFDLGCSYVDHHLGGLIRMMRDAGMTESNTAFVLTADHGVPVGASRRGAHDPANMFFEENLHIPLLVSAPGLSSGRSDLLASHLDIGPTILDFAGVPVPPEFRGRSLIADPQPLPYVLAENTGSGACDVAADPIFLTVRTDDLKVTYRADHMEPAEREVFAIATDSGERTNLVATRDYAAQRLALADIARDRVRTIRPPRA